MLDSMTKWSGGAIAAFIMATSLPACVLVTSSPSEPTGDLTMSWSIANSFDEDLCTTYGADEMELVVSDTRGNVVARAYQPCREFSMTLELPEGSYVGDATLIGSDNRPVSTTLPLKPFRIYADTETALDTDFPASSMTRVL